MAVPGPVQSPLALETGSRAMGTQESIGNGQAKTEQSSLILHLPGEGEPRGWGHAWCYGLGSLMAAPGSRRAGDTWLGQPVPSATVGLERGHRLAVAVGGQECCAVLSLTSKKAVAGRSMVSQDLVTSPRTRPQGCLHGRGPRQASGFLVSSSGHPCLCWWTPSLLASRCQPSAPDPPGCSAVGIMHLPGMRQEKSLCREHRQAGTARGWLWAMARLQVSKR